MRSIDDVDELCSHYSGPPDGVRANMIFSADGAAAFGGRAGPLSYPVDQQLLVRLRALADVVLVGAGTARAENYGPVRLSDRELADRQARGQTPRPPIAVVSNTGRLPDRLLSDPGQPPIVLASTEAADRNALHADDRFQVIEAGPDTVDVGTAVEVLRGRGLRRILCEGGPNLLDALVDADLVDEICVTIAPRLAGGQPMHRPQSALTAPRAMRLAHVLAHDDYLFLKYCRR